MRYRDVRHHRRPVLFRAFGAAQMVGFVVDLSRAMPAVIAGYGVITTPFGGVFRLDFALVAAVLFLLDYVCCRASRALRL